MTKRRSSSPHLYHAFISYAREDFPVARRIHRALERHKLPSEMPGRKGRHWCNPPKATLYPCFIDTDELHVGGLRDQVAEALRQSKAMVVLCSHNSAFNEWVDREIRAFYALGRGKQIMPVLIDSTSLLESDAAKFIPKAILNPTVVPADTDDPLQQLKVLAADMRYRRDGFRLAMLKVIAGVSGLPLRDLAQRQLRRARNVRLAVSLVILAGLWLIAGREANLAERAGYMNLNGQLDATTAQMQAADQLHQIAEVGRVDAAMIATMLPLTCPLSYGVCGVYDEEYGPTHTAGRTDATVPGPSAEQFFSIHKRIQERIVVNIDFQRRLEAATPVTPLPKGVTMIGRAHNERGPLVDDWGNVYQYSIKQISDRDGKVRFGYASIPRSVIFELSRAYVLRTWVPIILVLAFLAHFSFEAFNLRRLSNRPLPADE